MTLISQRTCSGLIALLCFGGAFSNAMRGDCGLTLCLAFASGMNAVAFLIQWLHPEWK